MAVWVVTKRLFIFSIFLFGILWFQMGRVLASVSPSLLEPFNQSTIYDTSPKLAWNYSGVCSGGSVSCFKVDLSTIEDFSEIKKTTYTNNFSYTPQDLKEGNYFWRVKAKDEQGNWSDYSEIFSFFISTQSSASSEPVVTQPPSADSSPQPSFFVSGLPSVISSSGSYTVDINLLNLQPNNAYYLKGAFYKEGSSNYFGKTEVFEYWIKNNQVFSSQNKLLTDSAGSWKGQLKVMVDDEDSGFSGSGEYLFKVGRYTSSGSGPTWSNFQKVNIQGLTKVAENSTKPKPITSAKTFTKPKSPNPSATLVNSSKKIVQKQNSPNINIKLPELATVAGVKTYSTSPSALLKSETFTENQINIWLIGLGIVLSGGAFITLVKAFKKG